MRIGVAVEGPSDRKFWDKVLHKHCQGVRFDIRNMKNRANLVRAGATLLDAFRSAHYDAALFLVDRDRDPCVTAVIDQFEPAVQEEARKPADERFLFICVAVRGLEAWFLADDQAVRSVFPSARYDPPEDTAALNPKKTLRRLWQEQYGSRVAVNKLSLAQRLASKFGPARARVRSASFDHFWCRLRRAASW